MKAADQSALFRLLPSVDELLRTEAVEPLAALYGRAAVAEAARAVLDALRAKIAAGRLDADALGRLRPTFYELIERQAGQSQQSSLRRVINATGVLIHTNLGRAPLSRAAVERIAEVATGYSNLEFDLTRGERGRRDEHAQRLFAQLFAREGLPETATLVVNNNAAAVLLALSALAQGPDAEGSGEVVVSRGELVEIGGSFRIPEIMQRSGAILREVGTTNRTRVADYEKAINERTRLLLRVHRSNFEIVGFTEQPALAELVDLGRRHNLPVVEDLGSGALVELERFGISGEPNVYGSLRAGVSLVTYSGDKLLGGPQAGLVSGDPALVARLRKHPLFRALRVDKLCYAALEATLLAYLRQDFGSLPLLRMMALTAADIECRCRALAEKLAGSAPRLNVKIVAAQSVIGGGAAPGKSLPSAALSLACEGRSASELAERLRTAPTPIIARVEEECVLLDLRTVEESEDACLAETLTAITPA